MNYNHKKIEDKWRSVWETTGIYKTDLFSDKPKHYDLVMFPYPSGSFLHIGHVYSYTGGDVHARFNRLKGFNVFEPIGYDAFGLPAENFAIKNNIHPSKSTKENIEHAEEQLKSFGCMFDWKHKVNTSDPSYYKWTQWLFLKLYEQGLAYQKESPVNWCPGCKTVLANEQVINGECERCDSVVEQKYMKQWFFKITDYADRLIDDLDKVDWPKSSVIKQRNWIGKSEGTLIRFQISSQKNAEGDAEERGKEDGSLGLQQGMTKTKEIEVFTTRVDTIFGCTYMVVAPENPISDSITTDDQKKEVEKYKKETEKKSELERQEEKVKTGVFTGAYAINPFNGEEVPVWVADYVLMNYGTGAVMAVPAHDERDWEFATKYGLPVKQVIAPYCTDEKNPPREGKENTARKVVHVILENDKGEVLTLNLKGKEWGDNKPKTLIIGGLEEGESPEETALREIKEECGYTDVEVSEVFPIEFHAEFFAAHKDVNRYVKTIGVFCKLKSEKSVPLKDEEKNLHDIVWVKRDLLPASVTIPDDVFLANAYLADERCFTDSGVLIDSGDFDGFSSEEAKEKMNEWLKKNKLGSKKINYRLRDWSFSRQRYWGTPIPVIYCEKCASTGSAQAGIVPVPEKDLPVLLPELDIKDVKPSGTGKGPLANISEFVKTKCPKCGGDAERESDTMDTFVDSSFYFLRYPSVGDPTSLKLRGASEQMMDPGITKKWLPVDTYTGGAEHVTMHLLYARFITKALHDAKLINFDEPFLKLRHQGMILGPDGKKMSKSKGNIVVPDEIIKEHGADVFRSYLLFMGPFEDGGPWNPKGMKGVKRFLDKVWELVQEIIKNTEAEKPVELLDSGKSIEETAIARTLHKTIKKVTEDINDFKFNTAISSMMECVNELQKIKSKLPFEKSPNQWRSAIENITVLVSPFAPYMAEEIWEGLGFRESIAKASWPSYDKDLIQEDTVMIPVQINGKVRAQILIDIDSSEEDVKKQAFESEKVQKYIGGKEIVKTVFVSGKLISIVVKG